MRIMKKKIPYKYTDFFKDSQNSKAQTTKLAFSKEYAVVEFQLCRYYV